MKTTKVTVRQLDRSEPDYEHGYHYAVEVRDGSGELVHQWTSLSYSHAMEQRKNVANWFELPTSVLPEGPIPC